MPPILMAILLVTVDKTEEETAVETIAFPVTSGSVIVCVELVLGPWIVIDPVPVAPAELINDAIVYPYKTTQR